MLAFEFVNDRKATARQREKNGTFGAAPWQRRAIIAVGQARRPQ
jgi:hypothetical protein